MTTESARKRMQKRKGTMAKKKQAAPPSIANRIVQYGTKPADQFQANPANWRKHPQTQRDALAGVLESVGWAAPVIENVRTGHLVDGHERVWQALQAGVEVPYVQVDVSENEERTLVTTLDPIGALADTDREKLAALMADVRSDDARVQELIAGIAERENIVLPDETGHIPLDDVPPEIDRAAELQKEWGTERGQVWTCGKHRVMCGDSTSADDVATLMDGKKARMIWSDPPYGVNYGNHGNDRWGKHKPIENDNLPDSGMADFWCAAYSNVANYCEGDLYVAAPPGPLLRTLDVSMDTNTPWERHQWLVWVKDRLVLGRSNYHYRHEQIWYGWLKKGKSSFTADRTHDSVFEIPRPSVSDDHPTMKPVELVSAMVENSSRAGENILDPFLGSGTTLIAAEQTGRVCYGMEISPAYVAVTLQRYKDVTGNTPVLT